MLCEQIQAALRAFGACRVTSQGTRLTTQCLYPDFEPVDVFVVGFGDGFKVHDGGGAARCGWEHAREGGAVARALARQAETYRLALVEDALVCQVESADWLFPAILAVANASSAAARAMVERAALAAEDRLKSRILAILAAQVSEHRLAKDYEIVGHSGKLHAFDFAIRGEGDSWVLIDSVVPHHSSISAKYVAFADTRGEGLAGSGRFAVYDRPLEGHDAALMQQVADLISVGLLPSGVARELQH